jgi:YspA, cpYpsA-related SLOG family
MLEIELLYELLKLEVELAPNSQAEKAMRILICASQHYDDRQTVYSVLELLNLAHEIEAVIHGDETIADEIASQWALDNDIEVIKFPAGWRGHRKKAKTIANAAMLRFGKPDLVVVFSVGPKSREVIDLAARAGLPIRYFQHGIQSFEERSGAVPR